MKPVRIAAAIPTLNRGALAADTVEMLAALADPPDEILVVDQTERHPDADRRRLELLDASGTMRWIRLRPPAIPFAMNRALLETDCELVLFLDDDIVPDGELVAAHRRAHRDDGVWAVAGQVLQPGEIADGVNPEALPPDVFAADLDFRFNASRPRRVRNVMAGNLSVKRECAVAAGGFDEQFRGAAYRFETDFARRLIAAGGEIAFEPAASIRHLKAGAGGLRTFGHHLTVATAVHTIGDYYFAYRHAPAAERRRYIFTRLRKSLLTRFHLRRPWWLLPKLLGELRGWREGAILAREGPRLIGATRSRQ